MVEIVKVHELQFGSELDDDELLVEADVLEGDALEDGREVGTFAQREEYLVAAKHLHHFHAGAVLGLVEGGAEHKLDGSASAEGEEEVGALDAVDVDVDTHGTHQGYLVGDAEGVGSAVRHGYFLPGFAFCQLFYFGVG